MHLIKNKLSEKMGRRDIQFYDVYKLRKPAEDVSAVHNTGYPLEGILTGKYTDPVTNVESKEMCDEDEQNYGDIEVEDFNKLFRNPDLIEDQFGQSISVKL